MQQWLLSKRGSLVQKNLRTAAIDDMVKLCDQLMGDMEQRTFISVQEIMAVYSIKERLHIHKPLLMKQMTLEKVFQKGHS